MINMENNIIHTINNGERVSSTYAEIYLDDSYCGGITLTKEDGADLKSAAIYKNRENDVWTSPSDLLIGTIELKPPFTSRITRGKTHEGILAVGNHVLETEQEQFLLHLNTLINENDAAWNQILEHEKALVSTKVQEVYENIFKSKSKIMSEEISSFCKSSLQELEDYLRSEMQNVLIDVHARIVSNLNVQTNYKLTKEKNVLENILKKRYKVEEEKIKSYYNILLQNELYRNNTLVRNAVSERNEALKAFFQQLEMENITNTMYIMCTERKKCKIKKIMLEHYHDAKIAEKIKKVKEGEIILESYKKDEVRISDVNKEWEEKIKKILQLFLKFISFSLKLLPEQATFLMDFEKMVVLQLNEIIQKPQEAPLILVEKENLDNTFKFNLSEPKEPVCDTEPIVITGTLEDPTPPRYGSRETLPSDVDLPMIRLQRQFIYAKCHEFEEIKKLLESQRCKCRDVPIKEPSLVSLQSKSIKSVKLSESSLYSSSNEPLLVNDINRLYECPVRKCKDWSKTYSFPSLESYLDFTEKKYQIVQDILGESHSEVIMPELLDPKNIILSELPFSVTKERFHTIQTQYSSQENSCAPSIECPCTNTLAKLNGKSSVSKESEHKDLNKILLQRKNFIKNLLHQNVEFLNMFTDESFDFVM